jgi:hypothetical protein
MIIQDELYTSAQEIKSCLKRILNELHHFDVDIRDRIRRQISMINDICEIVIDD